MCACVQVSRCVCSGVYICRGVCVCVCVCVCVQVRECRCVGGYRLEAKFNLKCCSSEGEGMHNFCLFLTGIYGSSIRLS